MTSDAATLTAALLGGLPTLKKRVRRDRDFVQIAREGLPALAVRKLADKTDTSIVLISEVTGIDVRTLRRRLAGNARLKPDESDRILRVARIFALARHALGEGAKSWLQSDNRALGGAKPIALLDTDAGARQVEAVLGRLEHGVFS